MNYLEVVGQALLDRTRVGLGLVPNATPMTQEQFRILNIDSTYGTKITQGLIDKIVFTDNTRVLSENNFTNYYKSRLDDISTGLIYCTYNELKELRDTGSLDFSKKYMIPDLPSTIGSSTKYYPAIITASSPSSLDPQVVLLDNATNNNALFTTDRILCTALTSSYQIKIVTSPEVSSEDITSSTFSSSVVNFPEVPYNPSISFENNILTVNLSFDSMTEEQLSALTEDSYILIKGLRGKSVKFYNDLRIYIKPFNIYSNGGEADIELESGYSSLVDIVPDPIVHEQQITIYGSPDIQVTYSGTDSDKFYLNIYKDRNNYKLGIYALFINSTDRDYTATIQLSAYKEDTRLFGTTTFKVKQKAGLS